MTVNGLIEQLSLTPVAIADGEREIVGGYTGDLLSWVMGNASRGCAWVTIMTNANIVAVASLIDMACVIVAEGASISDELSTLAAEKGVNLLSAQLPAFELSGAISSLL